MLPTGNSPGQEIRRCRELEPQASDAGRPSDGPPVGGRSGFPGKGEPLGLVQVAQVGQ